MRWLRCLLGLGALVGYGCTQDFDSFSVVDIDATAGQAATAGSADSAASGGASGAQPDGGGAEAGLACPAGQKRCGADCVSTTSPEYGCAAPSCAPCSANHATSSCDPTGACAIARCDADFSDCNAQPADGCEVNVRNGDPNNCGACGKACVLPNAKPSCVSGVCEVASCNAGYADCDQDGVSCESNLAGPETCGTCQNDCMSQPGQWVCDRGTCKLSQCPGGRADCDSNPNDCETDVRSSALHCGFCQNPCGRPNATTACQASQCVVTGCATGFGNCDLDAANGCEADLARHAGNCGSCGRACAGTNATTVSCAAGSCSPTCNAGHGDCTTPVPPLADDGCERDLNSDPLNCGACARACAASNVASLQCSGARCSSVCDLGWANCAQPTAPGTDDGCELDVRESSANCGGCANSCTAQNDMVCGQSGTPDNLCGCAGDDERCRTGGAGNCLSNGTCQCPVSGGGSITCRPGELCVRVGVFPNHACQCNAATGCTAGQVCCQTPAGCRNLQTDPTSCGACGRSCAPGFSCSAGRCACAGAASCNAGTNGSCNASGRCVCGATTCNEGERCLATGTCG